jgi:DNA-binding NtrC family response regulator
MRGDRRDRQSIDVYVVNTKPCRVLVVVEDPHLAELIVDNLQSAGHDPVKVEGAEGTRSVLVNASFDAAIIDLDTRARDGAQLVNVIRACSPFTRLIALLPCGGLAPNAKPVAVDLTIEKPARLATLLSALATSQALR